MLRLTPRFAPFAFCLAIGFTATGCQSGLSSKGCAGGSCHASYEASSDVQSKEELFAELNSDAEEVRPANHVAKKPRPASGPDTLFEDYR